MKISTTKRITALLSALILTVTGFDPAFSAFAGTTDNTSGAIDLTYTHFDIQQLIDAGTNLKNACLKENNDDEVFLCYQKVFDLYKNFGSSLILSTINKDVSGNSDEYKYENSIQYDALNAFSEALYYPFFESQYKELFEDNVPSRIRSYILSIHSKTPSTGFLDNTTQSELKQKYHELYEYANSVSVEDFEMQAAQIYIDLTKDRKEQIGSIYPDLDYEDAFYKYYNRDYSGQDIEKNKENIKKTSRFVFQYCMDTVLRTAAQYSEDELTSILYSNDSSKDYVSDVLLKYSPDISEDIYKSAQFMHDNNLFFKGTQNSTTGGYTSFLFGQNVPVVFVNGQSDRDTLRMVTHEFGHFNAFLKSDLSSLIPNTDVLNTDISEVQSQGMEVLFWNYYDDIYGNYSDLAKAYAVYQFAETFITGFFINDFESTVSKQTDTITPEELIQLYHDMQNEYGLTIASSTPFGYASEPFLQPFYTISYSVSLLPVWKFITETTENREAAIEKYTKFSDIDVLDPKNSFLKSLSDLGFGDILNENYINSIRKFCGDYVDSIEGILNGDINKDGTVSSSDLVLLKKIFLQDIDPASYNSKQADLNRDGKLSASDLVEMMYRLLK